MRFLADETVWGSLVRELTVRGHDVYLAKAEGAGSSDDHWLRFAADTQRILLTEDNDFGHLVFASGYSAYGVILIPFGLFGGDRRVNAAQMAERIDTLAPSLPGRWTVLGPRRTRQRPLRRDPAGPDSQ